MNIEAVKDSYGKTLRASDDLKTRARRTPDNAPERVNHHAIEKGRIFPVCGNTWRILKGSRFAEHFDFLGDFLTRYGVFPGCGTNIPFTGDGAPDKETADCC